MCANSLFLSYHDGADGYDFADWEIDGIIAGHRRISVARSGFFINHYGWASHHNLPLVGWWLLEGSTLRQMGRYTIGGAANSSGRHTHDLDIRAQITGNHAI